MNKINGECFFTSVYPNFDSTNYDNTLKSIGDAMKCLRKISTESMEEEEYVEKIDPIVVKLSKLYREKEIELKEKIDQAEKDLTK